MNIELEGSAGTGHAYWSAARWKGSALPLSIYCLEAGRIPKGDSPNPVLQQLLHACGDHGATVAGASPEDCIEPDPTVRLQAARAWSELAEIERTRAALEASEGGATQREIGRLLDIPQTEVHRLLRRARTSGRDWGREDARELILRHRAGLISSGTLMGRLAHSRRGVSAPASFADGYEPGPWDDIREAYLDGLLTDDEYDQLRATAEGAENPASADANTPGRRKQPPRLAAEGDKTGRR